MNEQGLEFIDFFRATKHNMKACVPIVEEYIKENEIEPEKDDAGNKFYTIDFRNGNFKHDEEELPYVTTENSFTGEPYQTKVIGVRYYPKKPTNPFVLIADTSEDFDFEEDVELIDAWDVRDFDMFFVHRYIYDDLLSSDKVEK